MQLSHEWMLIHDDIEDKSKFRRGRPSLHKIYGEEVALNCGDFLHTEASKPILEYIQKYDVRSGLRLSHKFYDIIKTTIEAQTLDLTFSHSIKDLSIVNEDMYYRIAKGKGAYYSVYGPLQLGAIVANKTETVVNALKIIGEPAGVAAQIQNDILDIEEGNSSDRGYQDLYEGKLTLIMLHAFNKATKYEREKIKSIFSKTQEKKSTANIKFLLDLIKKHKSLEYATQRRDEFGRFADLMFEKHAHLLPKNRFRDIASVAITSQYRAYQHT